MPSIQSIDKRQYYNSCDGYYGYGCGWSTGTRIGVGVAIAVGVILLVILLAFAARRRRRMAASSTRPLFGAPSAYFGGNQQQANVNNLPHQQGYQPQSGYQSYPAYDPTNVQQSGGYYSNTGNAGYQYPPPASFGNQQNYAPPEGPPPEVDSPYSPPTAPPPVYREGDGKKE